MTLAERQRVASTKLNYPPGTRLELIEMGDDPRPVASGTRGTVKVVDDMGSIHMQWDNGRTLHPDLPGTHIRFHLRSAPYRAQPSLHPEHRQRTLGIL